MIERKTKRLMHTSDLRADANDTMADVYVDWLGTRRNKKRLGDGTRDKVDDEVYDEQGENGRSHSALTTSRFLLIKYLARSLYSRMGKPL